MKLYTNKFVKVSFVILLSVFVITKVSSQTPADDPGIGGPGIGAAPAGDGSPVVPFDGGMSLMLLASGIGYSIRKIKVLVP